MFLAFRTPDSRQTRVVTLTMTNAIHLRSHDFRKKRYKLFALSVNIQIINVFCALYLLDTKYVFLIFLSFFSNLETINSRKNVGFLKYLGIDREFTYLKYLVMKILTPGLIAINIYNIYQHNIFYEHKRKYCYVDKFFLIKKYRRLSLHKYNK